MQMKGKLICPKCKNHRVFATIGSKHGQIRCGECGYVLDIHANFVGEKCK